MRGKGPQDVEQLCLFLGLMLAMAGKVRNPEDGQKNWPLLKMGLPDKFKQMVASRVEK